MAGYTRVDTINNIADGNVINAADLDGEFDGIQSAFNSSTGHNHDGTAGEGAPILALGPAQDVTISASVLGVKTTNTVDLGTSSLKFKDFYLAGAASIGGTLGVTGATTLSAALTYGGVTLSNAVTGTGNMVLSASPTLTGTITAAAANFSGAVALNGNTTIGDADTDTITQAASYVTGTQLKSAKTATNTLSLAAYDVDGTAYTNLITLTASNTPTLALTSTGVGTINNMSIGATTASTGAFTTLTSNGATTFTAGTASTSTTTGTAVITGGLGVSGRINAANFDGIVGANTAAAGTFTSLSDSGNLTFTGTGNRITGDFSNATFTNRVAFQTSTTNSQTALTVLPNGTNVNSALNLYDNSDPTNAGRLAISQSTTSSSFTSGITGTGSYVPMTFVTGGSERARIDTSGNVGIGTISPLSKLNVFTASASGGGKIRISGDTDAAYGELIFSSSNVTYEAYGASISSLGTGGVDGGVLKFNTGSGGVRAEKMRLDGSGNLLVGTTTARNRLTVVSGAGSNPPALGANGGVTYVGGDGVLYGLLTGVSTSGYSWMQAQRVDGTATAYDIVMQSAGSNLGIGTSSPSAKFQVDSSSATYSANIRARNSNFGSGVVGAASGILTVATDMNNIAFYTGSNLGVDGTSVPTNERMRIDSSGNVLVGKTASSLGTVGHEFFAVGAVYHTRNADPILLINRLTNDGNLVEFYQAGTLEGAISVSGTTVTYGGGHLARFGQLPDGSEDPTLLKGTVLTNLNEMCVWINKETGIPADNEQCNKVKISDVDGDANVAGVFVSWAYDEQHDTNDLYVAMTGDMIIRIAQGTTVQRGDLLISAGDGTAKPQGDDIVRSKTVAKVTSNHVTCTYADGSYCVPCVLMAC